MILMINIDKVTMLMLIILVEFIKNENYKMREKLYLKKDKGEYLCQ